GGYSGSTPDNGALSPDGHTAYVTLGGATAVAVVRLAANGSAAAVAGLIPTGWYPNSVSVSRDGKMLFVVNGKSNAGPNPGGCRSNDSSERDALDKCRAQNRYILQLMRASLLSLPVPAGTSLATLTQQVVRNNRWEDVAASSAAADAMSALRGKIHHVIYIIKENRSYDQILGDLEKGNGDPSLTVFPEPYSPNHHQLARQFVDLDNFLVSGEVSGNGWSWSTSGRATDALEKSVPVVYAGRGLSYDSEGNNRGINVGTADMDARRKANPDTPDDPDLLPGTANVSAPDGPGGAAGEGFLWNSILRAGLTLRNYGFFLDLARYNLSPTVPNFIKLVRDPHAEGLTVAFAADPALAGVTDPYYAGFGLQLPDFWRFTEWKREFDGYVTSGNLPSLELIRLPNDHFGNFANGTDGVNTV
ncbi:MAG: YncE family protein, partial [Bryobacteraceae bacterium]